MKKLIMLILSTFAAISGFADPTNLYLNVSDAELIRRITVITNLEDRVQSGEQALLEFTTNSITPVLLAGMADVGFVSQVVTQAMTAASYTNLNLSPYIGTNSAIAVFNIHASSASTVSIRQTGNTNNVDDSSMNYCAIAAGTDAMMICPTDSTGSVEVKSSAAADFTLIAFIRRHVFD